MLIVNTEKQVAEVSSKSLCEACGEEFSCGANIGKCWCFAVELKPEKLTELRDNFKNCLCQSCLIHNKTNKN